MVDYKTLLVIWAIVSTLWAITMTVFLFYYNPLPFPDRGHRVFGVPDDKTHKVVLRIIREVGGIGEKFTFDVGPTHQTLLQDGQTVIAYFDEEVQSLPANAISLPVNDPQLAAKKVVTTLHKYGYKASWRDGIAKDLPDNHLIVVESNAFKEWVMVLRLSVIKMPKPNFR